MQRRKHQSGRLMMTWCVWSIGLAVLVTATAAASAGEQSILGAEAAFQGPEASDAFSAIHYLGDGRIIAGKRSSYAANRFLLSEDEGETWQVLGCPGSTGSHTYFFGQNGATLLAGTGDTGSACLMRSTDGGATWSVVLSAADLRSLVGSTDVKSVFSPVYLGEDRWIVNLKSFDTRNKVIMSSDDGVKWSVPSAQPGQAISSWARQMILTSDGVLLWPSSTTDRMYLSSDEGSSWSWVTVPGAFLFQPLCDAGDGVYFCGEATVTPYGPIRLYRSVDAGQSWTEVVSVNLQRPSVTYWRDVISVGDSLLASACCVENTSDERHMRLYLSRDGGDTWVSLGNPYIGPYGGMQAIYQMCVTAPDIVFAGCQPDCTILRWPMPVGVDACLGDLDFDGDVDLADLGALLANFHVGGDVMYEQGDIDLDGDVDLSDLGTLLAAFGEPCD
jgi:hypothetical protein